MIEGDQLKELTGVFDSYVVYHQGEFVTKQVTPELSVGMQRTPHGRLIVEKRGRPDGYQDMTISLPVNGLQAFASPDDPFQLVNVLHKYWHMQLPPEIKKLMTGRDYLEFRPLPNGELYAVVNKRVVSGAGVTFVSDRRSDPSGLSLKQF
jgi:hypothetical protein